MTENTRYQQYQWITLPDGDPVVLRNCGRCKTTTKFIHSDDFRINAQKKILDVWLIYHCEICNNTWNMAIFSRIPSDRLDPVLYHAMAKNDHETARKYAFDVHTLSDNRAVAQYDHLDFRVEGPSIWKMEGEAELEIRLPYQFPLRVDKVLGRELGISRPAVGKLFAQELIENLSNSKKEKSKIAGSLRLRLRTNKIRDIIEKEMSD